MWRLLRGTIDWPIGLQAIVRALDSFLACYLRNSTRAVHFVLTSHAGTHFLCLGLCITRGFISRVISNKRRRAMRFIYSDCSAFAVDHTITDSLFLVLFETPWRDRAHCITLEHSTSFPKGNAKLPKNLSLLYFYLSRKRRYRNIGLLNIVGLTHFGPAL